MKKPNKKTVHLIARIAVMLVAGVFLGTQLYAWNARNVGGDSMPMPFGVGVSIILSGSMEPELSVDDVIIVKEQDAYSVGDMVVFQSHGDMVVHRIISMDGDTVTTKGDANNSADEPISLSDIKGGVTAVIPGMGKALRFIKSPYGIIIVLGAALLLMELSFRREKKASDQDLEPIKEEIRRLLAEQEAAKAQEETKE